MVSLADTTTNSVACFSASSAHHIPVFMQCMCVCLCVRTRMYVCMVYRLTGRLAGKHSFVDLRVLLAQLIDRNAHNITDHH